MQMEAVYKGILCYGPLTIHDNVMQYLQFNILIWCLAFTLEECSRSADDESSAASRKIHWLIIHASLYLKECLWTSEGQWPVAYKEVWLEG